MTLAMDALLVTLCDDPSSGRERLLHAAGILFAERGRTGVSTRELTRAAGVNLSAIAYYFGGKDGLYTETLNYTIAGAQKLLGGAEAALSDAVVRAEGNRRALSIAAVLFVHDVTSGLLGLGPEHWPKRLVMREIDHPSDAFDRLYDSVFRPLHEGFRDLVVAATGRDPKSRETIILSSALLGECLIFHRNRPVVLRCLGWSDYSPEGIEAVVRVVATGILDTLALPHDGLTELAHPPVLETPPAAPHRS